jgi:hypothetical protein
VVKNKASMMADGKLKPGVKNVPDAKNVTATNLPGLGNDPNKKTI